MFVEERGSRGGRKNERTEERKEERKEERRVRRGERKVEEGRREKNLPQRAICYCVACVQSACVYARVWCVRDAAF